MPWESCMVTLTCLHPAVTVPPHPHNIWNRSHPVATKPKPRSRQQEQVSTIQLPSSEQCIWSKIQQNTKAKQQIAVWTITVVSVTRCMNAVVLTTETVYITCTKWAHSYRKFVTNQNSLTAPGVFTARLDPTPALLPLPSLPRIFFSFLYRSRRFLMVFHRNVTVTTPVQDSSNVM